MDPAGILNFARLVKVENKARSKHLTSVIAHEYSAPGCLARSLHAALVTSSIRSQPRCEHHVLVVKVEVHSCIVHQCCLVQIDVDAIISLELERCLHTSWRENSLRSIVPHHSVAHTILGVVGATYSNTIRLFPTSTSGDATTNVAQSSYLNRIFLSIVVASYPPSTVVACHCKLGLLLLDDEVVEVFLQWELITEAHAVVIDTETDCHVTVCALLIQVNS